MKVVPGWPGYKVSKKGRIWSCRNHGRLTQEWHELKPRLAGFGYPFVTLCNGKKVKSYYIHHLVLIAYVSPRPDGMEAIHLNDVKMDNRLSNLKWGTHLENCKLRRINGRDKLGERRKNTKLTSALVRWMRSQSGSIKIVQMAKTCGVAYHTAYDVIKNKTWKHLEQEGIGNESRTFNL